MPKTRPPYPAEFGQQMVELVRAGGKTPAELSREFECSAQTIAKQWCPPASRKRPIDLVLLSIGGNDVGFGALALYAVTESARDHCSR